MYRGKFAFQNQFQSIQIPSTSPQGDYIRRGHLTEGFLRYDFGGLIFGAAYTWRGLFSEFYGTFIIGKSMTSRRLTTCPFVSNGWLLK